MDRRRISLARPTLADRRRVYGWMTTPGIVEKMMGPPTFPEIPVPTWEEFAADYPDHLWTHNRPQEGRVYLIRAAETDVGCIAHNDIVTTAGGLPATELDLWLAGPEHIGRGYGRAAIMAMCDLVVADFGVEEAFLQPSARNPIACAAYTGAGFAPSLLGPEAAAEHYRTRPDYRDGIFFVKRLARRG